MIISTKVPYEYGSHILLPIRARRDYIMCLLRTIEMVNPSFRLNLSGDSPIEISFQVKSNFSRLFIKYKNKTTSLYFPFRVSGSKPEGFEFRIGTLSYTSSLISNAISFLELNPEFPDRINPGDFDVQDESELQGLKMIMPLIPIEPSYLRFEEDEVRESRLHPKYHLDINYTRDSTFKVGLTTRLGLKQLHEILDNEMFPYYLMSKGKP